jgi:hypothetical protein
VKLNEFVEGLQILIPHYKNGGDGYYIGAEHDQFYAYATETPLTDAEVTRMRELGWFQPDQRGDSPPYTTDDGWSCYT